MQVAKGDKGVVAGIEAWLRSRDPEFLTKLVQQNEGQLNFVLDGKKIGLESGVHFAVPS